ncbi:hypothetical protein F5888DRAFT_675070 [Russula emetica]|nr:hypothetical protein F5888DRAFT_675070 [Russula emetica]
MASSTRVRKLSCALLTSALIVFHGLYLVCAESLSEGWGEKPANPRPSHHSERKRKHGDPNSHVLAHAACSGTPKQFRQGRWNEVIRSRNEVGKTLAKRLRRGR